LKANGKEEVRKALIISVSDYKYLRSLPFCKNDGEGMYSILRSLNYNIPDTYKLVGKVTHQEIEDAIYDFFTSKSNKPKDLLLFYFSGHGVPEANGDNYLSSYEIDPDEPYRRGFSFNDLAKTIDRGIPENKVIILDCCYSGAAQLSKGLLSEENAAIRGTEGINRIIPGRGKCILAACQGSEEAYAIRKQDHSIFTHYLLEGLYHNEKAINKDGNVTPDTLGKYVYEKIMSLPLGIRPKQKPIRKIESSGDIILASYQELAADSESKRSTRHNRSRYNTIPAYMLNEIMKSGDTKKGKITLHSMDLSGESVDQYYPISRSRQILRTVYDAHNGYHLPGTYVLNEGYPMTGDTSVNEAYEYVGVAYHFYEQVLNRNSIDDKGSRLDIIVHYGRSFCDSFWDGSRMVFGDGDGKIFQRFTKCIDIVGREFTHGVVEYETDLEYYGQSGALVEHFCDVFGTLIKQYYFKQTVDRAVWLIGEGIFTAGVKGRGLRSLKAPGTAYNDPLVGRDIQPSHMKDYVKTHNDNGGVHINSGIPNKAFYLIALGIGGFAWEKLGKIWYISMRRGIAHKTDFDSFARITFETAGSLFGHESIEQKEVFRGWDKVGLRL
jgi:hypothetical protein